MTLTLRYAARSDRGLIRGSNQDSVYAGPRLLAVADGMGGHAAGEVASNDRHRRAGAPRRRRPRRRPARTRCARPPCERQRSSSATSSTRTPSSRAWAPRSPRSCSPAAGSAWCHVGDSRAYLLRDGELVPDHPGRHVRPDAGRRGPDHRRRRRNSHPQRSLLLRALNGQDVEPDLSMREARAGDRYLLCSDGLSGVVSDETIAETLREYPDPQRVRRPADRAGAARRRPGQHHGDRRRRHRRRHRRASADRRRRGRRRPGHRHLGRPLHLGRPGASALARPPRPPAPGRARTADRTTARPPDRRPVRTAAPGGGCCSSSSAVGSWYGWSCTQRQWYVGRAPRTGAVAVFRGLPGQIVGFDLSDGLDRAPTKLDDLTPAARSTVRGRASRPTSRTGRAPAGSADATRDNAGLPVCPTDGARPPAPPVRPRPAPPSRPAAPTPAAATDADRARRRAEPAAPIA